MQNSISFTRMRGGDPKKYYAEKIMNMFYPHARG